MTYQQAYEKLKAAGQTHVLRRFDSLSTQEQTALLGQIEELDLSILRHLHAHDEAARGALAPLGALTMPEIAAQQERFRKAGEDAIRAGKVGAVLLAGGQGTRLGLDGPKGTLDIGKTRPLYIFECLIGNLKRVVDEAGAWVPLYIMTSDINHETTISFFETHDYFGYDRAHIRFFIQEMAPVVDVSGKLLMESGGKICTSPNGNGGWFSSMAHAGLMPELQAKGIEWLNVFAVDNVLQQIADPLFIGATLCSGCDCGSKVVAKANAEERVGVLCLEDGKPSIVEYYEMTDEMRTRLEPDGRLSYNYGVILNYLFRTDRLLDIVDTTLPVHVVKKKVNHVDETGAPVQPDEPNAYKFETLVLDMVHLQKNALSYEVDRAREFAPIKNRTGADSVESAQALLQQNGVCL